jgi:hypothetical protein
VYTTFSDEDIRALEPMMKIGLLATVNDEGLPHITLISSLRANTPTQVTWGQFTEGLSKGFVQRNPRVGFLVMTLDRQLWRGKARFSYTARQGPEFDFYNNTPMFRYNAYFGIHTVYYMDLLEHSGRQALPMGQVVLAAIQTMAARTLSQAHPDYRHSPEILNIWTRQLMNKLDNLKFLSYVAADGHPVIIPTIQAQIAGTAHILFSTGAFREDLQALPLGATVALFGMSLEMEDVLLRGEFQGFRRIAGIRCGTIQVNWVYSPMPPKPQQIYPPVALEPVTAF